MTFTECLINVLVVIGYIAWFAVSITAIGYGAGCWLECDCNWFTNTLFFVGVISLIFLITTCIYRFQ